MAELAQELKKQTANPSIDSYGESNVFVNYKQNKFYEKTNIIELKKAKIREKHEFIKEIQKLNKEREREERLKKLEEERQQTIIENEESLKILQGEIDERDVILRNLREERLGISSEGPSPNKNVTIQLG